MFFLTVARPAPAAEDAATGTVEAISPGRAVRELVDAAQGERQRHEAALIERFGLRDDGEKILPALKALCGGWLALNETGDAAAAAGLRLAIEQAALRLDPAADYDPYDGGPSRRGVPPERWRAWLKRARAHTATNGGAAGAAAPGPGIHEAAYESPIDGSPQPFRYSWPPGPADQPRPLVVMLHGYVPYYNKESWVDMEPATAQVMDGLGAGFVWPFGRGNTDFLTIGEEDVLAVVEAVARRHSVDRRRIILAGYSMGGSGVWTLLAHYPDRWAGALVWSGRNNWFYWQEERLARSGLDRENFPAFKKWLVLADNPYDLDAALADIPIRAVHPSDDFMVKPGQTSRIFGKLRPPRGRMEIEQPEHGGHFFFINQLNRRETWEPFLRVVPSIAPTATEHIAYTPKYGVKRDVTILALGRWGEPARVRVRRVDGDGGGEICWRVEVLENIRALALRPPRPQIVGESPLLTVEADAPGLLDAYEIVPVAPSFFGAEETAGGLLLCHKDFPPPSMFNIHLERIRKQAPSPFPDGGEEPPGRPAPADQTVEWPAWLVDKSRHPAARAAWGGVTGCYGPVKEAFNQRFVLVLGTGGTEDEQSRNRRNLAQFLRDWKIFAHADAPWLTDTDYLALLERRESVVHDTPARRAWDLALSGTVICFGQPRTHRYLEKIAAALPFRFLPDGYGVGPLILYLPPGREPRPVDNGLSAQGDGLGFVGIYPRPGWRPVAADGAAADSPAGTVHPYVVVIDGLYYGERQSFNHKWDMVPDYLVFGPEVLPYDDNNAPRLAGYFDARWRFDPALAWTFGPPPEPVRTAGDDE